MTRLRSLLLALILALVATPWVDAQTVHVKPYTRKDGTPVKGHDRRAPTKKGTTTTPAASSAVTESADDESENGLAELADPTREPLTGPSSRLLGLTATRVREALGIPSLVSGGGWNYDRGHQTLHVYFKGGVVSEIRPRDIDLSTFIPKVESAGAAKTLSATPTPPPPPEDAVAQCGDGLFVHVATGDKTCSGHGGVAKWLRTQR